MITDKILEKYYREYGEVGVRQKIAQIKVEDFYKQYLISKRELVDANNMSKIIQKKIQKLLAKK